MERSSFDRSSRTEGRTERRARLHGDSSHHLQQVILDHIVERAGLLIIRSTSLDADRFRTGDLYVIDVSSIPERLEDPVAEAKRQNVLDGFLAEVVIDAIDLGFVERFVQVIAQFACAGEVVSERLLHDEPSPAATLSQSRSAESLCRARVLAGLRGEIEHHVAAGMTFRLDLLESGGEILVKCRVADVSGNVVKSGGKRLPHIRIEGGVFGELFDGLFHLFAEGLVAHGCAGDSDYRKAGGEPSIVSQAVESR